MTADALLEQLARDIRAWERAEAIEVVQVWLNGWGYWVAEWRTLTKKRGPDQYDYFSASGSAIPFGHLLDDIVEAGKAHGVLGHPRSPACLPGPPAPLVYRRPRPQIAQHADLRKHGELTMDITLTYKDGVTKNL
jgi:hypothetical protein